MGATLEGLTDLFVRLAEITSPSGRERGVADLVIAFARDFGFEVVEDEAAGATDAGSGNVVVRVPAAAAGAPAGTESGDSRSAEGGASAGIPIALVAHMDTVPVEGEVRVVIENGVARSAGDTILGGDDKAAVTVLLALIADFAVEPPPVDVDVVFTVSEEVGLLGAKHLDLSLLRAKAGFVFDSEGPVGTVVMSAPSLTLVDADFRGKAAHAGIEPEKGRSALVAAARAVAAMRLGRLDDETTANVGRIEGGSATNVITERCRLSGEARSRDRDKLAAAVAEMIGAVNLAAAEVGVDVSLAVDEDFVGFALKRDDLPVRLASAAMAAAGVEARYIGTGGGSDTNVFNQRGLPCVTLGVGFENVHSSQETLVLARLLDLYAVGRGLVEAAGRTAS